MAATTAIARRRNRIRASRKISARGECAGDDARAGARRTGDSRRRPRRPSPSADATRIAWRSPLGYSGLASSAQAPCVERQRGIGVDRVARAARRRRSCRPSRPGSGPARGPSGSAGRTPRPDVARHRERRRRGAVPACRRPARARSRTRSCRRGPRTGWAGRSRSTVARPRAAPSSVTVSTIWPVAGEMNVTPPSSATAIRGSGATVSPVSRPSEIAAEMSFCCWSSANPPSSTTDASPADEAAASRAW